MITEELNMDFSRLEAYLKTLPFAFDLPGFDLAVRKDHEEIFRFQYGFMDAERTKPIDNDSMQWIYSMSKVITCVSALRLYERGLLGLDDPVYKYLPEYKNITVNKNGEIVKAENTMLVRHLFAMRSGMNYDLASPPLKKARENKNATTRELVAAMAENPLSFEPGTSYQYSLSHDVIAAIVEVVSGKTFHEYLKEEIFEPLGMYNIGFHPTDEQKERICALYRFDPYRFRCSLAEQNCAYVLSDKYESGGAGLFCTNDDYMQVIDALANNGTAKNGYVLLKPETIELYRTNQQPDKDLHLLRPGYGYGLGVRTLISKNAERGESLSPIGEFGWDGAANSYNMVDTKNKLAIVMTVNVLGFGRGYYEMHPHIRNLVYEAIGVTE
ncbi:MAG: beta-lactamase family protein [Clostridiales bacterium]|nr:beta-lactamase family protein [Clostridiales bacterium]